MVLLTTEPLQPQQAVEAVMTDSDGAYVQFVGVVRDHSKGRSVTGLEYQVYAPMAVAQLEKLVAEVKARWGLACAILHRYGFIPVGETAVVVCVASSHRAEAFDACRWAIDTLKADVPIWKKEFCPDGTFWIEGDEAITAQ
ncbi:molybdenum cofactor biosynthesis protein MoaE [Armatimonas rosea]|uniref:Molybdopterin synthase catalytic subunit n=1 Tax=Armatimonas rosea TaxID=685828 RepID=A0A7W9SMU6_ARMRO|nr:molybdenum cofactor biosynthesis protein MoaE [Armatimonas rosea]MBB6048748.1 molybdopterin synthase catalytic subunit [Armatimonas rosea]